MGTQIGNRSEVRLAATPRGFLEFAAVSFIETITSDLPRHFANHRDHITVDGGRGKSITDIHTKRFIPNPFDRYMFEQLEKTDITITRGRDPRKISQLVVEQAVTTIGDTALDLSDTVRTFDLNENIRELGLIDIVLSVGRAVRAIKQ